MAKSLLPLRVSLFRMGVFVSRGETDNEVEGVAAHTMTQLMSMFPEFNMSVCWVTDGTFFGIKDEGKYTGVLGQFVANESDALLLTLPMSPEADVAVLGPPTSSSPSIIVSVTTVREFPDMILDQLFRFSADIVILLLTAITCFALVLRYSVNSRPSVVGVSAQQTEKKRVPLSLFLSAWYMIVIMLKQGQEAPNSRIATRVLLILTAIGVFFWFQVWENQMKTEMFLLDASQTVQSVDDALRMNRTAVLYSTDPSQRLLQHIAHQDPGSQIAALFRKSRIVSYSSQEDQQEIRKTLRNPDTMRQLVVIVNSFVFHVIEEMVCMMGPYEYLIGGDKIGDQLMGPWYNRLLGHGQRRPLDRRYVRIRESGMHAWFFDQIAVAAQTIRKESVQDFRACVYRSLNSYLEKVGQQKPPLDSVDVAAIADVFRLLLACLSVAAVVLLLEQLLHRIKRRKRVRPSRQESAGGEERWLQLSRTLKSRPLPLPLELAPQELTASDSKNRI